MVLLDRALLVVHAIRKLETSFIEKLQEGIPYQHAHQNKI